MKVRLELELGEVVTDISSEQLQHNIHHHVDNVVRAVLEGSCESWESYELNVALETDKQHQLVELTRENFEAIIRNANGYRDLAFLSLGNHWTDSIEPVNFPDTVTMFTMHTALELILKALRFIATGKIDRKSHKYSVAYQKPELSQHRPQLESLYQEAVSKYESRENNVNRKIAKKSTQGKEYEYEYNPSNLLETLKTLDSMKLHLKRYSHEEEDNWSIQEGFKFLFILFDHICQYTESDLRHFSVTPKVDRIIKKVDPDGTTRHVLDITGFEEGKDQRKASIQLKIGEKGMMKLSLTPRVSPKRIPDAIDNLPWFRKFSYYFNRLLKKIRQIFIT